MVDISALGGSSPSLTNSRTGLADNMEMFLTLLTEQMKNQDPLDPLDSTQFVNQLVDFSSVEQQINQNQNLENILLVQSAAAQTSSVGYIGREATASTPSAVLEDGSANWQYVLPREAESTSLTITDASGRLVARLNGETGEGPQTFSWDGTNAAGAQMPDGVYSLEVTSLDGNGDTVAADVRTSGIVTGIDLSGSEVIVAMGGVRVPLSSIQSLQERAQN
jgi:flagellar basal-body rod modification protein FlgD